MSARHLKTLKKLYEKAEKQKGRGLLDTISAIYETGKKVASVAKPIVGTVRKGVDYVDDKLQKIGSGSRKKQRRRGKGFVYNDVE